MYKVLSAFILTIMIRICRILKLDCNKSWSNNGAGATEIIFDSIEKENEDKMKRQVSMLFKSVYYNKNYEWTDQDINNAWEELKSQNYFKRPMITENREEKNIKRKNYSRP